ncbi:hypothetical protein MTO96_031933 [Rhipicephalus appendiculatus]
MAAVACYPDVGVWYLIFRSYYEDPEFGGVQKCVLFQRYGIYSFENYSTSVEFLVGRNKESSIRGEFKMTSSECYTAKDKVKYRRYDSYGCSYWLRIDTGFQDNDGCEFIYDENCGTSPKYYFYDNSCPL